MNATMKDIFYHALLARAAYADMKKPPYSTEVKTRAVELLIESQKDYPSLWAAIQAIAPEQHAAQGLHTRNPTRMASKASR